MDVYFHMVRAYFKARSQYRKNFFCSILIAIPYQVTSIAVLYGVFSAFHTMDGWSYIEIVFLGALLNLVTGLANGLFKHMRYLENDIISGNLDIFLVRPRTLFFQIMIQEIDLFSILGMGVPNLLIVIVCLSKMSICWSLRKVIFIGEVILFGVLFWGCVFSLIGGLAFWFYRTNHVCMTFIYSVQDFVQYPISIYNKIIIFFLSCIFPVAFVNYYPLVFLRMDKLYYAEIAMAVILLAAAALVYLLWKRGLSRYQGTGS